MSGCGGGAGEAEAVDFFVGSLVSAVGDSIHCGDTRAGDGGDTEDGAGGGDERGLAIAGDGGLGDEHRLDGAGGGEFAGVGHGEAAGGFFEDPVATQ